MFPLYWICGEWKSNRKPSDSQFDIAVQLFRQLFHFHQSGGIIWADLLGRVQLAYDREEDRLVLATEGIYVRADDS